MDLGRRKDMECSAWGNQDCGSCGILRLSLRAFIICYKSPAEQSNLTILWYSLTITFYFSSFAIVLLTYRVGESSATVLTFNLISRLEGTDSALVNWLSWMELCQEEIRFKMCNLKSNNYASERETSKPSSNLKYILNSQGRSLYILNYQMLAEIYLHMMIFCFFIQVPSYNIIHLTAREFGVAVSQDFIPSPSSVSNDSVTFQSLIFIYEVRVADLLSNVGRNSCVYFTLKQTRVKNYLWDGKLFVTAPRSWVWSMPTWIGHSLKKLDSTILFKSFPTQTKKSNHSCPELLK